MSAPDRNARFEFEPGLGTGEMMSENAGRPLAERPLLRIVGGGGRLRGTVLAFLSRGRQRRPGCRDALARRLIVGRHLAVRRINDDGCSNLPSTSVYAEPWFSQKRL
jgi:hypothetical protein